MIVALTREISPAFDRALLTFVPRRPLDIDLARAQHGAYCRILAELGCRVEQLPADPGLPDSVFVEDTAVVLEEVAILTRPGAPSRRAETAAVEEALGRYRDLMRLEAPGHLDGGDVLVLGKAVYVGRSSRSDAAGITQLERLVAPFGYRVIPVPVSGCLHLKSAATRVGPETVLVHPGRIPPSVFRGAARVLEVDPGEPEAANVLPVAGAVLAAVAHPRTAQMLAREGFRVRAVDVSEIAKAEGALTCCSLIFEVGKTTSGG